MMSTRGLSMFAAAGETSRHEWRESHVSVRAARRSQRKEPGAHG